MKKFILSFIVLCSFFLLIGCENSTSKKSTMKTEIKDLSIKDSDISKGYVRYDLKEPLKRLTEGVGAQFDTCVLDFNNNQVTDWKVYEKAVQLSNLQAVRIRFYPEMYERGNDNDDPNVFDYDSKNVDFNSIEMNYLYKVLDLMEANHVNVDLSWYGCRTTFISEDGKVNGSWLGGIYGQDGVNGWMAAPSSKYVKNPDSEFAESVVACLNYLINVKGYTCIYEYSIFPEPEGVISDMTMYKNIAQKIKKGLQDLNLDTKVKFSGPADYGNNAKNLDDKYLSKNYGYDKVDSSVYCFHGDTTINGTKGTPSTNESMYNFAKAHVEVCDKYNVSWGVAESGTSNFLTAVTNSDTEIYDRAITMTRFFVNLTNAGCTNIKYFIFADCSYDGITNEEGLFRFVKSYYTDSDIDYQAKPIWYAWSLIMRYTDIGSEVYPITTSYENGEDPDVCITALKLPDGSWTYIMANIGSETKKVAICNENMGRPESMQMFKLTAGSTPFGSEATLKIIDKTKDINTSNGVAEVTIPANGIIVLSDKN